MNQQFTTNNYSQSAEEVRNINISSAEMIEADTRANVDIQVTTAKKYPRNLPKVLENILFITTQDKETAESCFYAVKRDGKTIRGASIRLAEVICNCYGNIRAWARIVANDGKTVTAQGFCWDLENNTAFGIEVKRRITDKHGRTYSDDMIVINSNAACSIALRNAILKVIPLALTAKIQNSIKSIIMGESKDFDSYRKIAIDYFKNTYNVTEREICDLFEKKAIEQLTRDDIFDLKCMDTALKDGDTSIDQLFTKNLKTNAISNASKKFQQPPVIIEQVENNNFVAQEVDSNNDNLSFEVNTSDKIEEKKEEKKEDKVVEKEKKKKEVKVENTETATTTETIETATTTETIENITNTPINQSVSSLETISSDIRVSSFEVEENNNNNAQPDLFSLNS